MSKRKEYWQQHEAQIAKAEQAKSKASTDQEKTWKKAVSEYLIVNSFCEDCKKRGYTGIAEQVVHADDPKSNPILFWNILNWKAVCSNCFESYKAPVVIPNPIRESVLENLYTVK
ncbi:hypothetical protein [Acinetobacter sp. CFCC 10889]|uniref:hypothetical protein n=1 Tax=Acinetobacter sp. CFCC 10889 TaxID=1775557 RepID=UPI000DD04D0B|nr:hypothetical protein [Acinetobacter sp. CFCC 10889]